MIDTRQDDGTRRDSTVAVRCGADAKGRQSLPLAKASSERHQQRITHFTEELPFLSEQDKDWVMGRAIMRRLGWT